MYALQTPDGRALINGLGQVHIYATRELAQAVLDNDTLGLLDDRNLEICEVNFHEN